jgi:hypothetical protein
MALARAQVPALQLSNLLLCFAVGVAATVRPEKLLAQGAKQGKEDNVSASSKVSKLMPDISKRPFQLRIIPILVLFEALGLPKGMHLLLDALEGPVLD